MQTTSPFAKGQAALDALELTGAADERPVDAAAVDDRPRAARALEGAVLGPRDEVLGIGLERDVVQLGQPADGHAVAGQLDRRRFGDSGT